MPANPPKRSTYRHGDLRNALLAAGTELAREGGPEAVVLREATRRVGVAPNAAYRHFADRDALLRAVCSAAQSRLAVVIEEEQDTVVREGDPSAVARALLRAVGTGYLRFAQTEPELFRTAFAVPSDQESATSPERAGNTGLTPLQLLSQALDGLVEAGVLTAERRPGAEFLAWSAVHGLATLLVDGPLRGLAPPKTDDLSGRLLDMIDHGLR
ncbi:TetR/AcrR family transcriptional regulator [Salinactinospora qingdaonensis]|uniref:TetR/AcrR family transcriptional regulator n=1 Tax=Salinactinospora qingdaonensis TaxID=702744 RepID=A0ABP7F4H1_9ACTN